VKPIAKDKVTRPMKQVMDSVGKQLKLSVAFKVDLGTNHN
jgi:hypothetical protein